MIQYAVVGKSFSDAGSFVYQVSERYPCRHGATQEEILSQFSTDMVVAFNEWDLDAASEDSYSTKNHRVEVRVVGTREVPTELIRDVTVDIQQRQQEQLDRRTRVSQLEFKELISRVERLERAAIDTGKMKL